jgi:hypothetical protein
MTIIIIGTIRKKLFVYNVLQLPEGGDFGTLNYQQTMNLNRSTKPDLTTEPPLLGRCCYARCFFLNSKFN